MERTYRTSNAVYVYAFLLALSGVWIAFEATQQLRVGNPVAAVFLALVALTWLGCAGFLVLRWGQLRITVSSDQIAVTGGEGPERRLYWADVYRVRELRGPAYQLMLRGLLPGPYLPLGLIRSETVLEIAGRPASRVLFRQALVQSYPAFQQDVLRSVPRDTEVDLHARWWRDEDWSAPPATAAAAGANRYDVDDDSDPLDARDQDRDRYPQRGRPSPFGRSPRISRAKPDLPDRTRFPRRDRAGGGGYDR